MKGRRLLIGPLREGRGVNTGRMMSSRILKHPESIRSKRISQQAVSISSWPVKKRRNARMSPGGQRCICMIRFRFHCIQDFDGISSTRDSEDGTAEKVFGKLLGIESSWCYDEFTRSVPESDLSIICLQDWQKPTYSWIAQTRRQYASVAIVPRVLYPENHLQCRPSCIWSTFRTLLWSAALAHDQAVEGHGCRCYSSSIVKTRL